MLIATVADRRLARFWHRFWHPHWPYDARIKKQWQCNGCNRFLARGVMECGCA